jgi:outer membrane beta-barrel protein
MKRIILDRMSLMTILLLFPSAAIAQEDASMSFSEEEVGEAEDSGSSAGGTMSFGVDETAGADASGGGGEGGASSSGEDEGVSDADVLSALGEGDESSLIAEAKTGKEGGASDLVKTSENVGQHPIWAVQRVYVLRARRVDLQPNFGFSFNDPYVQHQAFNLGLSYYITEVLAAGVSFNMYKGLDKETDLNFSARRATHQIVPINEYFWGGQLNFTYVPIFGKFAMFKQWILHWDMWVIGGGGFIFTRPIPTIDSEYREFDYTIKFCFNVGIGWRLFLSRFLAVSLELRDYIFPEELESRETSFVEETRENDDTWLDDEHSLTNNVMLNVGLSIFIPFTFEYKLKK